MKAEKSHRSIYGAPFFSEELERMNKRIRWTERELDRCGVETIRCTKEPSEPTQSQQDVSASNCRNVEPENPSPESALQIADHVQNLRGRTDAHGALMARLEADIEATAESKRQARESRKGKVRAQGPNPTLLQGQTSQACLPEACEWLDEKTNACGLLEPQGSQPKKLDFFRFLKSRLAFWRRP